MSETTTKKDRARVRTRLQPAAWAFIATLLLVQMAAFNTGENLLYLVSGGVLGFLVVSVVFGRLSMAGLTVSRDVPESAHRGETFLSLLRIENKKHLIPTGTITVKSAADPGAGSACVEKIYPRKAALVRVSGVFAKRGVRPAPPLAISSAYPFGLTRVDRIFTDAQLVTVYPRVRPIKKAALDQLDGMGVIPRVNHVDGDEFYSLRDYIPGDELRRITWKVSARRRKLTVRELEPNTSRSVMLVFDTHMPGYDEQSEDEFEEAVELVASLAIAFLARQYTVGVATRDRSIPLGIGNAHGTKIMEMLARVTPLDKPAVREDWFAEDFSYAAANLFITPDSRRWGRAVTRRGARFINPKDVVHA